MQTINLWSDASVDTTLTLPDLQLFNPLAPALLVIPGGGYGCVCHQTEGDPIAQRFTELGFRCFILNYRVSPHAFPAPLQDAVRAMRFIRANASTFRIRPDMIAATGFSAGGHLAASLGTIPDTVNASDPAFALEGYANATTMDATSPIPNALFLAYPVITANQFAHLGSVINWSGHNPPTNDDIAAFSIEQHISDATPPAFVWSTIEDSCVPCENSILFFNAMRAANRPCSIHIFPTGNHGMQLGYGHRDIALWPEMARTFACDHASFAF